MFWRSTLQHSAAILFASQNPSSPEKAAPGAESKANAVTDNATPNQKPAPATPAFHNDVVIKGGTILTVTHGKIENGSVYIHNGKIAAVGQTVNAPAGATVIDAAGKFVMPGIIDSHSHIALDDDVNEPTSPITPHMMMRTPSTTTIRRSIARWPAA